MNDRLLMLVISAALLTIALLLCVSEPTNCWDQYTTENAAILGCEK